MKKRLTLVSLMTAALLVAGCGGPTESTVTQAVPAEVPAALAAVFGHVAADALSAAIPELRGTASPGDDVVLEAKVMGTKTPFVDNRALFVVGDEGSLTSCDLLHDGSCETPWDTCCDESGAVLAGTATIQVVDAEGNILRHGIKGVSGLKELSRVRVTGKVAPKSTDAAFIINATKIQVL